MTDPAEIMSEAIREVLPSMGPSRRDAIVQAQLRALYQAGIVPFPAALRTALEGNVKEKKDG